MSLTQQRAAETPAGVRFGRRVAGGFGEDERPLEAGAGVRVVVLIVQRERAAQHGGGAGACDVAPRPRRRARRGQREHRQDRHRLSGPERARTAGPRARRTHRRGARPAVPHSSARRRAAPARSPRRSSAIARYHSDVRRPERARQRPCLGERRTRGLRASPQQARRCPGRDAGSPRPDAPGPARASRTTALARSPDSYGASAAASAASKGSSPRTVSAGAREPLELLEREHERGGGRRRRPGVGARR